MPVSQPVSAESLLITTTKNNEKNETLITNHNQSEW